MITKFVKYNESIKSLLVGPTKEEVWDGLMNGKLKGFLKSIPTSPEDFFNQMKDGCEVLYIPKNNFVCWGKIIKKDFWSKNKISLFIEQPLNKYLYVSYDYIWSVLEIIYGLNYDEIKSLIEELLIDTNWSGLKPNQMHKDSNEY